MTVEELKEKHSMRDILSLCGLPQPNRTGFVHCPFHQGDREPSMKIYRKDYHCFGCGENGDIFSFVQKLYGMTFKEAFLFLGGDYEQSPFSLKLAAYHAQKKKEMHEKQVKKLRRKQELNSMLIDIYREYRRKAPPFSDVWTDCSNALQYQLYVHEALEQEGMAMR